MHTPQHLVWHAKRHGVPMERAQALWNAALGYAARHTQADSSGYWALANDRLLCLLEQEQRRQPLPNVIPLLRTQRQLGATALQAWADLVSATTASLRRHHAQRSIARRAA